MYRQVYSLQTTSLYSVNSSWEVDVGKEKPHEVWPEAFGREHNSSICAYHSLIQGKIIHRAQWTKVGYTRMYAVKKPYNSIWSLLCCGIKAKRKRKREK